MSKKASGIHQTGRTSIDEAPRLVIGNHPIPKLLSEALKDSTTESFTSTAEWQPYLVLLEKLKNIQELDSDGYLHWLKLLLYMEEYQNHEAMCVYNVFKQNIVCMGLNIFCIEVPDLADDKPPVTINDKVCLIHSQTKKGCAGIVVSKGQKHVNVKIQNQRFLKEFSAENQYDVRFCFQNYSLQCGHYAVHLINKYQITPLLFPEHKLNYNKPEKNLRWFNPDIQQNDQQKQAILNIMGRTAHPAPYILFGPPGTGKTATLVEAVCQIWDNMPSTHILICTPSNTAADEITKRLVKVVPPHEIYRMNAPARQSKDMDIEPSIRDCTNFVQEETVFLPKDMIMLKKIVIVTLLSCIRLLSLKLWESHFAYVFVDEAGQATEVENLIPLCLMSSEDDGHVGKLQGQLIISGDPQQLGPVVLSDRARPLLGKSMLERLMKRPLYQKNKNGNYDSRYITKLLKNYRSHASILKIPNELFYENELLPCGGDIISRGINWEYLPNKKFPIIFHAAYGAQRREPKSTSLFNTEEVTIVVQYVEKLLNSESGSTNFKGKMFTEKNIGIITPYKLQEKKIAQVLHAKCIKKITVGTVEIFQGQEKNVIILSTVRSVSYANIHKCNIGFLSDPKRLNVALTRAQALLIVVGNPHLLGTDHNWQTFIEYCRDNGGYRTSESPRDKNSHGIDKSSPKKYWDSQRMLMDINILNHMKPNSSKNEGHEVQRIRRRSRKPKHFPMEKNDADNVKNLIGFGKEEFPALLLQTRRNGNMNGSLKILSSDSSTRQLERDIGIHAK